MTTPHTDTRTRRPGVGLGRHRIGRHGRPTPTSGRVPGSFVAALLALVVLLVAGISPAGAQDNGDDRSAPEESSGKAADDGDREIQIVEVDDTAYPVISLVVSVPPAFAGELRADQFAMSENDQVRNPSEIVKLQDPLEVVILVDTSGSMRGEPLASAKEAAKGFVASLDDSTDVSVVGFGSDVNVLSGFGDNRAATNNAIDLLTAEGNTALYQGLSESVALFRADGARRFLIVLSDGKNTVDGVTIEQAEQALAGADLNLYAITLGGTSDDFTELAALTDAVDGNLISADDETLATAYDSVASRINNLYRLTYKSRAADGIADIKLTVDIGGNAAFAQTDVEFSAAPELVDNVAREPGERELVDGDALAIRTVNPTGLSSANAIWLGAALLFAGFAFVLFLLFSREKTGPSAVKRLNIRGSVSARSSSGLSGLTDRASSIADRLLTKGEQRGALDASLEKAGIEMRPGEFVVAATGSALGLGIVLAVLRGPIVGLIGLGIGFAGSRFFVTFKASRRQAKFGEQLGDTLMMIAGSLRAGHGVVEAIDTVASQAEAPTGEEFSRAVAEARIGRDMVQSLYDIAERTGSEDFIWVVRAISINRELGGDLAEILDNVGETIRDRNRLRDQVKALSAEGKISAMILFALPVLVAIWVKISNPEYMDSMLSEGAGKVMAGAAVFSLLTGGLWLKKLVNVEF